MDGTKATHEKAAVLPVPAGSDANAAPTSSARQTPSSDDAPAAAAVDNVAAGGGAGEEEEDEQVERFYALLANIRAMKGVYVAGGDDTVGGAPRKRLRGAEPPWRPAFRLEDFEEPSPTSKSKRRLEADDGESGARPAVAAGASSSPTPPPRAGVRPGSSSTSI